MRSEKLYPRRRGPHGADGLIAAVLIGVVVPSSERAKRKTSTMKKPLRRLVAVVVAAIAFGPIFSLRACATEAQKRIEAAIKRGFQTRDAEMSLGRLLGELVDTDR